MSGQFRTPSNPATLSSLGAFDAYVQDEQERKAREEYQAYLDEGSADFPPHEWPASALSFGEWCMEQAEKEIDEPLTGNFTD